MPNIGEVVGAITMRDQFSRVFDKYDKDLTKAGDRTVAVGRKMTSAGIALTKAVTLPIAAIGGLSVKAFSTFDQAMTQSLAIMGDVSDSMQEDMADAARELPLVIKASAAEAAAGFEFLARAGKKTDQVLALLPITARFANAGIIDLALGTDLLTDAQSALGLSTEDVQQDQINMIRVSDVLVKANTLANASIIQFSRSLTTKAGDSMRRFSQDVEEGVSILAAWADQGVKGELAGERYSIVLRDMTNKSIANREAFLKHNIAVFDQTGKVRSLVDIIEDMEVAFEGMSDEMRRATLMSLGFTFKSVDATSSLIGLSGRIRQYEKDLRSAGGATQEVSDNQMKSFAAQMTVVKNRIIDVGIELGSKLAPIIESKIIPIVISVADFVRRMVDRFGELPSSMRIAIVAVVAFVAALGLLLVVAGAIVTAWGFVVGALGGVAGIAAAAGITAAFAAIGVVIFGPKGIVAGFRMAAGTVKMFWERTKEARTFVVNLAKVIGADLSNAVGKATGAVTRVVIRFLDWLGVDKRLRSALTSIEGVVVKLTRIFGFFADKVFFVVRAVKLAIKELGGLRPVVASLLAVLQLANPVFASGALKIIDWTDRARDMTDAAIDLAAEVERDTVSVEEMDTAFAKISKTWIQAAKEVKVLSREEIRLIRLQNAVAKAALRMAEANKQSSKAAIQVRISVNALGESLSTLPIDEFSTDIAGIWDDVSDNISLSEVAALAVAEQIQAILDAETLVVEKFFAQLDIQEQINELFESGAIDKSMKKQLEVTNDIVTKWEKMHEVLDVFSEIDGIVGDIARGVVDIVEGFKSIRASGGKGSEGFGAGLAGIAGGIDSFLESTGAFKGQGGVSSFGGKLSGDFSTEGGQVGQVIGAIVGSILPGIGTIAGAAIGKVLGKIVGSLIKSGADTAEATIRQISDDLTVQVTKEEGPLGRPIRALAKGVIDAFDTLEAIIGGEVAIPDFKIKIREEVVTAWVNGLKAKFTTIGEAIDFVVTESIKSAEFGEGVSERFVTALTNASLTTVEELEELLQVVAEIETIASESGVVAQGFKALGIEMKILERVIAEAGLDAADAVLVQAFKVKQIREAITSTIEGIIGIKDVASGLRDLVKSAEEFNTGIDAITASRQAELDAAMETAAAVDGVTTGFEDVTDEMLEGGKGLTRWGDIIGRTGTLAKKAGFDVDKFSEAMEKLPKRIDIKELQKAATVAAAGVGVALINMIEAVRGEGFLAAQRQELQGAAFKVQLGEQIKQLVALSEMTTLFSAATIAGFQFTINAGLKLLDDLSTGAASIDDQAKKANTGRGKARRAAEESFRESAERVIATLAGATEASFTFADSVRAIRDQAKEAKITLAETEQAISNLAELEVGEIAQTWSDAVDSIRRSDLGNAVAEIMARAQVSIDEINARADANQEAANEAMLIVSQGVQAEMHELGRQTLLALSGPVSEAREEFKGFVRDIRFMVRNVDDLGLTLVQVANKIREGVMPQLLAIGVREAERLGLDEKAAEFRAKIAEIEMKVQFIQLKGIEQMLIAAGAMDKATKATFDEIFALFGQGRDLIEDIGSPDADPPGEDVQDDADTAGDAWVDAGTAMLESTVAMTESFMDLVVQFGKANRKTTTLTTRTMTLTSEMSDLAPALFTVQRRTAKLITELGNFPSSLGVSGFSHGSNEFLEFGSGTLIGAHGKEEIVTEARGKSTAEMVFNAIQRGNKGGSDPLLARMILSGQEGERIDRQENTLALRELLRVIEGDASRTSIVGPNIEDPL